MRATYTLLSPSLDRKGTVAGLVSDHVIPVYKLWVVKKKSASLVVLNRGQQRLARGCGGEHRGTRPAINC